MKTLGRRSRVDFSSTIAIMDGPPTPGRATAVVTPEGYLDVDAYIARDGLLRYSDGTDSWVEYRPRVELERALASFAHDPVTDDHPRTMVSADSWRAVAVGHTLTPPVLEVVDGVAYARSRLRIADAATIAKVRGGKVQVSIGFTAAVVPTMNGAALDGTRCDAVQTEIVGNHRAIVDRGRAGPAVRLLMDDTAWYDCQDEPPNGVNEDPHVANPATRADQVGPPTETTSVKGPDGSECVLPTWAAAELAELARMRAAAPVPAPAPAAAPVPDAVTPVAPVGAPMPAAPAVAPAPAPAAAPEDKDKDDKMTKDSITEAVRKRGRLERLASKAGIEDARIDAADDVALAREVVAKRMPWAKDQAAKADGAALDALLEAAVALPAPAANPFEPALRPRGDEGLDEDDPEIRFLKGMET